MKEIKSPWASNLPIFVFTYLLDEGYKQLANNNEELPSKGNDMEPKAFQLDLINNPHIHQPPIPEEVHEEYPPKDGYENSRQLNVVARAMLMHPDLAIIVKYCYIFVHHEIFDNGNLYLNDMLWDIAGGLERIYPEETFIESFTDTHGDVPWQLVIVPMEFRLGVIFAGGQKPYIVPEVSMVKIIVLILNYLVIVNTLATEQRPWYY
ncbi:hypothetical protein C1645_816450 [Glomus cerebriforme]|uniref:Uncharacterized protein n=1 Tax=Glomus cerebriforme TaxID=658196 RepID=A0A397TFC0_9GLOM|nr:hypothetical protein C1645_816450 [Glomus cerebriforme]